MIEHMVGYFIGVTLKWRDVLILPISVAILGNVLKTFLVVMTVGECYRPIGSRHPGCS